MSSLHNFLKNKKVAHRPSKQKDQQMIVLYIASFFVPHMVYSEKEVNAIIQHHIVFEDYAIIRRALYDAFFLNRHLSGSSYIRSNRLLPIDQNSIDDIISLSFPLIIRGCTDYLQTKIYREETIKKRQGYMLYDPTTNIPQGYIIYNLNTEEKNAEICWISSTVQGGGTLLINQFEIQCIKHGIRKRRCRNLNDYQSVGFYQKIGCTEQFLCKKQRYDKDAWYIGKYI